MSKSRKSMLSLLIRNIDSALLYKSQYILSVYLMCIVHMTTWENEILFIHGYLEQCEFFYLVDLKGVILHELIIPLISFSKILICFRRKWFSLSSTHTYFAHSIYIGLVKLQLLMQTGDAELEMRGRCSAGQKVNAYWHVYFELQMISSHSRLFGSTWSGPCFTYHKTGISRNLLP